MVRMLSTLAWLVHDTLPHARADTYPLPAAQRLFRDTPLPPAALHMRAFSGIGFLGL